MKRALKLFAMFSLVLVLNSFLVPGCGGPSCDCAPPTDWDPRVEAPDMSGGK